MRKYLKSCVSLEATFSDKFGEVESNKPTGDLGEEYFRQMCLSKGILAEKEKDSLDWDFNVCGKHVDVKVLRNNFGPKGDYNVNVRALQVTPYIDVFAFLFFNMTTGEHSFAGAMTKDEFLARSTLKRAGERNPNGFCYHCDTYVIAVNQLKSLENTLKSGATVAPLSGKSGVTFGEKSTTFSKKSTTMAPLSGKRAPLSGVF